MRYKYFSIGFVAFLLMLLCHQYYLLHRVTTAYTKYDSYYEYVENIRNLQNISTPDCYEKVNPDLNEGMTTAYKVADSETFSSPNKVIYHLGTNPCTIVYTENNTFLIEINYFWKIKSIIIRREV